MSRPPRFIPPIRFIEELDTIPACQPGQGLIVVNLVRRYSERPFQNLGACLDSLIEHLRETKAVTVAQRQVGEACPPLFVVITGSAGKPPGGWDIYDKDAFRRWRSSGVPLIYQLRVSFHIGAKQLGIMRVLEHR